MEAETVSPGAAPAATPAAPVSGQAVLDGMSSEQLSTWERTGALPGDTTPSADSSSAKPAEQAAVTTAKTEAPASEPGTPAEKKGAKARSAELDTDIQSLRERLRIRAELRDELARTEQPRRTDAKQPESSSAPTQTEWKRIMAQPDAPKEADFDSFAEFTAAASYYVTNSVLTEHTQRSRQQSEIQRHVDGVRDSGRQAAERIATAIKADPEFASKVDTRLLAIETASVRRISGQPIGPQHVIADEIVSSEHTDKLLLHFSTEDGQKDFRRLMGMPPQLLLREFGRIEERLGGAKPASESQAPPPKTLSTAPPPGKTLGTRTTEPVDPSDAALKRKDFAAYEAAENARTVGAR